MAIRLTRAQLSTLRKVRKKAGLSQTALARELGVTSQLVNQVESGKKAASLDVLERWGQKIGFDVSARQVVTLKVTTT